VLLVLATALETEPTLELEASLDVDIAPELSEPTETELSTDDGFVASSSEQAVVTSAIRNTITTAHNFIVLSSGYPDP